MTDRKPHHGAVTAAALVLAACAVGPDFTQPAAPPGCGLYARNFAGPDRFGRCRGRRGAAFRRRREYSGRVVDAVPFRAARRADRRGAQIQPDARSGAGDAAPGQGKRGRGRRGAVSRRERKFLRHAAENFWRGAGPAELYLDLHADDGVAQRLLRRRRVRRRAAAARIGRGASRVPALRARSRRFDADLECRCRRDRGSLAARANRRDPGHHRRAKPAARRAAKAVRAGRRGARRGAGAAGDPCRDSGDHSQSAKAAGAAAHSARRARRPPAEPGDQRDFRSRPTATPARAAAELAVRSGRATARHPGLGGAASRGKRAKSASPSPICCRSSR